VVETSRRCAAHAAEKWKQLERAQDGSGCSCVCSYTPCCPAALTKPLPTPRLRSGRAPDDISSIVLVEEDASYIRWGV
jgi:hypothetical protein